MKTITFYSYKGGVGRSLALSNIAIRLSQLGQKVCVIDFDLDAPGLRFKFKNYNFANKIKRGIVDYIYKFSSEGYVDDIGEYTTLLKSPNKYFEDIKFISAGDIDSNDYWKKLSMIRWYDLFYSENPQGVDFFIDLKAQIQKKFNPDFLLIDSRTGITDISGVTLRLLADQIVVLGINNPENLFGCQKVIKSLINPANSLFDKAPKVNYVLTRLSINKYDREKEREVIDVEREYRVVERIRNDFKRKLGIDEFDISVIHTDRRLEYEEGQLHRLSYDSQPGSVSRDYLNLFEKITDGYLVLDEKFLNTKKAELEYVKSLEEFNIRQKLVLINKAISLDNTKFEYFLQRGFIHFNMGNYEKSIEDNQFVLKLAPDFPQALFNISVVYITLKDYESALPYLEKAGDYSAETLLAKGSIYRRMNRLSEALEAFNIGLKINPSDDGLLNSRADVLRALGKFKESQSDISQAILIDSNQPIYFATLAEIYSSMHKNEEFFLNIGIALSNGLDPQCLNYAYDVYQRYFHDERFIALMAKYSVDIKDIRDETIYENYKSN
jgi:tetratricopeptide (TPR) repeat protein/MinD-like ATPase involved in chromosome partitioning or flagellar assembly